MAIIETKLVTRPNTSKNFFNESSDPAFLEVKSQIKDAFGPYKPTVTESNYSKNENVAGTYTHERRISDNGLLQTSTATFNNLSMYSTYDSTFGIALDYAYKLYVEGEDFVPPTGPQYTLTGIDAPFSCTTTYTYNSNTETNYPLFESFITTLEYSDKLVSFTNSGTAITVVHHYQSSEDFTNNHWIDYTYISGLYAGGVTRTIAYAML
jgi:hypothetical protein